MYALTLHGARDARFSDVPEPTVGPGTVKIKIEYGGICGSDLALYEHAPIPDDLIHPLFGERGPHVLGHEFSGHVVEVADDVEGIPVGSLVAVRPNVWDGTCTACLRGETNLCEHYGFRGINGGGGGFSEYVVVGSDAAHVLPASIGADVAAMVESTTVAWHAARVSGATESSTALIIGAGPIGLGLLLCLRARGISRVVMSELSERRKALAAQLGADVVDPRETDVAAHVRTFTAGAGVDVAFDASGVGQPTYDAAFGALRSGGTAVVVAQFHSPVTVDLNSILTTEKRLVGSFAYTDADFSDVVNAVASGRIDPRPLISSTIPLSDVISGGIEHLLGEGRNSEIKVLVRAGS